MLETLKREEPGGPSVSPTFAVCSARYVELRRQVWTSKRQAGKWTASLEKHAFPRIGLKPVDQITESDIVAVQKSSQARPSSSRALRVAAVVSGAATVSAAPFIIWSLIMRFKSFGVVTGMVPSPGRPAGTGAG